jgi:hypothetical protein
MSGLSSDQSVLCATAARAHISFTNFTEPCLRVYSTEYRVLTRVQVAAGCRILLRGLVEHAALVVGGDDEHAHVLGLRRRDRRRVGVARGARAGGGVGADVVVVQVDLRARSGPAGMLSGPEIFSVGIYNSGYGLGPKNRSWGSESRGGAAAARARHRPAHWPTLRSPTAIPDTVLSLSPAMINS